MNADSQPDDAEVFGGAVHSSSSRITTSQTAGPFRKCAPQKSRAAGSDSDSDADDDDGDEDDDDDGHARIRNTIYAPISTSQPRMGASSSVEAVPGTSYQRIAVAAIPNVNFNQPSMARGSASSPSLHIDIDTDRRRSNERNNGENQLGNFKRSPASSSDYFM